MHSNRLQSEQTSFRPNNNDSLSREGLLSSCSTLSLIGVWPLTSDILLPLGPSMASRVLWVTLASLFLLLLLLHSVFLFFLYIILIAGYPLDICLIEAEI